MRTVGRRGSAPAVVFSMNRIREALWRCATLDSVAPGIRATIGLPAPLERDLDAFVSPIADHATARALPPVPAAVPRLFLLSHVREHTLAGRGGAIPEATRINP